MKEYIADFKTKIFLPLYFTKPIDLTINPFVEFLEQSIHNPILKKCFIATMWHKYLVKKSCFFKINLLFINITYNHLWNGRGI